MKMNTYKLKKVALLSLVCSSVLFAGGYKIPETSTNGVALSAANIAHNINADSAYYNPANMVYVNGSEMEVGLMYIGLEATNYKSNDGTVDIDAKSESFLVPSLHYVSDEISGYRFGFSLVSPGGLSKRWDDSPAVDKAKEFTLEVVEFNPTIAMAINEKFSVGFGLRALYSSGVVKSNSAVSRDMDGDSIDFGYNIALSYKVDDNIQTALTYRSNVDLTEEGSATLYDASGEVAYDGGSSVTVPLPASLSFALAYTIDKTTIEFVYEKNFWSSYEDLDFDYAGNIGNLTPYFDDPIDKSWEDVNAYRLGITHVMDELTLMGGMVYDESPIPEKTLSYELPSSDALSISLGGRYQIDKNMNVGISALYLMADSRDVTNDDIDGEFSNSNVLLISTGLQYKF